LYVLSVTYLAHYSSHCPLRIGSSCPPPQQNPRLIRLTEGDAADHKLRGVSGLGSQDHVDALHQVRRAAGARVVDHLRAMEGVWCLWGGCAMVDERMGEAVACHLGAARDLHSRVPLRSTDLQALEVGPRG
jgi:hypothetical protein